MVYANKGISTIILVIGIFVIGIILLLPILKVFEGVSKITKNIVEGIAVDIKEYIVSFTFVDGGSKFYQMGSYIKPRIVISGNDLTVSADEFLLTLKIPDGVEPTDITTNKICISKDLETRIISVKGGSCQ